MATSIEELNIQISASTTEATKSISSLCRKLKSLQTAMENLDVSKITGVTSALGSVASSLKDIAEVNASKSISGLGRELAKISNANSGVENVTKTMESISSAASNASGELQKATKTLNAVSENTTSVSVLAEEFSKINQPINEAVESSKKLKESMRMTQIKLSADPLREVQKMIDNVKNSYEELRRIMANKISNTSNTGIINSSAFEQDKEKLEALRQEYLDLLLIKNKLSQNGGDKTTTAIGTGANNSSKAIVTLKSVVDALGSSLANVNKKIGSFVYAFSGISTASKMAKSAISSLIGTVKNFVNNFIMKTLKMFKTMIRRKIIRAFMSEIGEGFKNMVQYSSKLDESVSLLWNSFRQFGNAVGAMVAPLINTFAPALNFIIQKIIEAVNWVNQLLSALAGATTWTKAKLLTDSYADSLDESAKNAKKLKNQLQSFDALNNLTTKNDSSATNIADMFETEDVDNKFLDLVKKLKLMFETGNFYDLGSELGQKLKDMLDNIPWSEIREKARKLGKALASLINGFIGVSGLGRSIGKTWAEALNTAFEFLNGFVHELDWKKLGKFIGDTLNGFFENIDWDLIYDTFVTGFEGLANMINSFVDSFHWSNLSTSIGNVVNILSNSIYKFFKTVDWKKLGSKIGEEIRKTILKIDWRMLGKAIGSILQSAFDFVASIWDQLSIHDILEAINNFFKGVFEEVSVWDLAKTLMGALGIAMIKAIPSVISKVLMANALKSVISSAMGTATTGIASTLGSVAGSLGAITSLISEFFMVKDGLHDLVKGCGDVEDAFAEIASGVGIAVTACTLAFGPYGAIAGLIVGLIGTIAGINDAFDEIQAEKAAKSLREFLKNDDGRPISEVVAEIASNIRNVADGLDGVITEGSKIPETQKDIDLTVTKISGIQSAMDQAVIGTEDAVKQLKDAFADLSKSASEKFGEVQDTLLAAFGSGGSISVALGNLGVDVVALQGELTGITQATQNRINELTEEIQALLETDPNSPKLQSLQEELYALIGVSDDATKAIGDCKDVLSNIDYSGYIKTDEVALDTTTFISDMESITNAMSDAYGNIDEAFKVVRTSLETELNAAKQLGDTVKTQEIEKALQALDSAMASVKDSVTKQGKDVADAIQTEYVDRISDVIDDAKKRWEEMSWIEQMFTGAVDVDDYAAREAINYIEKVIDPMAEEIEKAFANAGIDGAGWADETAKSIMENIGLYIQDYGYMLSDDYREVVSEALKSVSDVKEDAKDLGKATTDGIVEGMDASAVAKTATGMANAGLSAYAEAQDSNSPSKEYEKLSLYSVQGLVKGFEDNAELLLTAIKEMAISGMETFKEVNSQEAWENAFEGIVPAFEKVMKLAIESMKKIWNNFADTFNEMAVFEIDEQTYEGKKIASSQSIKLGTLPRFSTGGFPENGLFLANSTEMVGKFSNGRNAVANNEQIVDGISKGVASANSEQNMLLRQQNALLQGILEKETGISSDALFRSVQQSANSYFQRTGNYAF